MERCLASEADWVARSQAYRTTGSQGAVSRARYRLHQVREGVKKAKVTNAEGCERLGKHDDVPPCLPRPRKRGSAPSFNHPQSARDMRRRYP
jgi:hypothetical protein